MGETALAPLMSLKWPSGSASSDGVIKKERGSTPYRTDQGLIAAIIKPSDTP